MDVAGHIFLNGYKHILYNETPFSKETLNVLRGYTDEVLKEMIAKDPLSKEVYENYSNFQNRASKWSKLTEQAYYNKIQK